MFELLLLLPAIARTQKRMCFVVSNNLAALFDGGRMDKHVLATVVAWLKVGEMVALWAIVRIFRLAGRAMKSVSNFQDTFCLGRVQLFLLTCAKIGVRR
jgi:hypothetical protein